MAARFAQMRRLTAEIDGIIENASPDQLPESLRESLQGALQKLRQRIN